MKSLTMQLILQLIVYPAIMTAILAGIILYAYFNSKKRHDKTLASIISAAAKIKTDLVNHGYDKYLETLDNSHLLSELEALKKEYGQAYNNSADKDEAARAGMLTGVKIILVKEQLQRKNVPQWIIDKV